VRAEYYIRCDDIFCDLVQYNKLTLMKILKNRALSDYTSLGTGGPAERLLICETSDELRQVLSETHTKLWVLGYGTNVLVSDKGLPGHTVMTQGGSANFKNGQVVVDAGMWWDDLVLAAIENGHWGIELMSGIPSSVGAAVYGNIAAYGQQVFDTLQWVEVYDISQKTIQRIDARDIQRDYRSTSLQQQHDYIILRACFSLSDSPTGDVSYTSALTAAAEIGVETDTLSGRRAAIMKAREQAGSLYMPHHNDAKTAGSFFKNPLVEPDQAKLVASYDETGKSLERLLNQNKLHGGNALRVSAAHVLLAAGFKRGQSWGAVRLHPQHVLKLENSGGATSQEIYDVAQHIMQVIQTELNINLEPEVKFLGHFNVVN